MPPIKPCIEPEQGTPSIAYAFDASLSNLMLDILEGSPKLGPLPTITSHERPTSNTLLKVAVKGLLHPYGSAKPISASYHIHMT
jgi:hypothetical protein